MDKEKKIEEIETIIAENMAIYSKAKMPYSGALRMCALGILASGYGNIKEARKETAKETAMEIFELLRFGYELPIDDIAKEVLKGYGVEVDE